MKSKEKFFVRKAYRRFFIPSFLSSLFLALGSIADGFFVGNNVGETGLATIAFGTPIYIFCSMVSIGLAIGGSVHYANELSQGDVKAGNTLFSTVFWGNLCIQVLISVTGLLCMDGLLTILGVGKGAAEYDMVRQYVTTQLLFTPVMFSQAPLYYFVHTDNNPRLAAAGLIAGNVVDIVSNYVLVGLLQMGVRGSVYSTVLGAVVCIIICQVHLLARNGSLRFGKIRIRLSQLLVSVKTGFATSTQYLYQFFTFMITNNLLMRHYGITAVAIFDIIYSISLLIGSVMEGTGLAMEPMVSTFSGERNKQNIRYTFKSALFTGMVISLLFMLVLSVFGREFCMLFGLEEGSGLTFAAQSVWIYGLSVIPFVLNSVFSYYYQALGKEQLAYLLGFCRIFVFYLLFLFVFIDKGIAQFFFTYAAAEAATLLVLGLIGLRAKQLWFLQDIDDGGTFSIFLDARKDDISDLLQQAEAYYEKRDASPSQVYYMTLVIEEICAVIANASKGLDQEEYIQITVTEADGVFTLYIRDNSVPFNPFGVNADGLNLADTGEDGIDADMLSMKIVRGKAKEFFYRQYAGFNTLVIKI